ncbi:MAG: hypothetical protein ACLR02_05010 [Clostridium sp.]|nr:hypothetical protein [Clostridium sp.]
MENNNEKLGGGIITISVLTIIGFVFSLISSIMMLTSKDSIVESYKNLGMDTSIIPTTGQTIVGLILSILIFISIIFILMKKSIGVYGYFIFEIISIIANIIFSGFSILNIASGLIFPIIMAIFISKKRNIFGL